MACWAISDLYDVYNIDEIRSGFVKGLQGYNLHFQLKSFYLIYLSSNNVIPLLGTYDTSRQSERYGDSLFILFTSTASYDTVSCVCRVTVHLVA